MKQKWGKRWLALALAVMPLYGCSLSDEVYVTKRETDLYTQQDAASIAAIATRTGAEVLADYREIGSRAIDEGFDLGLAAELSGSPTADGIKALVAERDRMRAELEANLESKARPFKSIVEKSLAIRRGITTNAQLDRMDRVANRADTAYAVTKFGESLVMAAEQIRAAQQAEQDDADETLDEETELEAE